MEEENNIYSRQLEISDMTNIEKLKSLGYRPKKILAKTSMKQLVHKQSD